MSTGLADMPPGPCLYVPSRRHGVGSKEGCPPRRAGLSPRPPSFSGSSFRHSLPSRRASSFVLLLIAEILALRRRAAQPSHSEQLVEKATFLMGENICSEINLSGIGETLGVSTSHLNEVFMSYTAMTPYQYFISIKMRKAKELLERGDLSIKEVAFRLADLRLSLSVGGAGCCRRPALPPGRPGPHCFPPGCLP
jgi:AraC-like DNA-binding protein